VVVRREDEFFPHAFWLVTSWTREQMPAEALLTHYRQRGTAEGHFGELMDVLAPALSSAKRLKSNYQGHPPVRRSVSIDAFGGDILETSRGLKAPHYSCKLTTWAERCVCGSGRAWQWLGADVARSSMQG